MAAMAREAPWAAIMGAAFTVAIRLFLTRNKSTKERIGQTANGGTCARARAFFPRAGA
jgi:hypothetical protein